MKNTFRKSASICPFNYEGIMSFLLSSDKEKSMIGDKRLIGKNTVCLVCEVFAYQVFCDISKRYESQKRRLNQSIDMYKQLVARKTCHTIATIYYCDLFFRYKHTHS